MNQASVIGVLTIFLNQLKVEFPPDLDYGERLDRYAGRLVVFTPFEIDWNRKTTQGLIFTGRQWEKGKIDLPHVVYNRLYGTHQRLIQALTDILGPNMVYNQENRLDKLEMHNLLAARLGHYLPSTARLDYSLLSDWLAGGGPGVILKPCKGHYGRSTYLVQAVNGEYHVFTSSVASPRAKFGDYATLQTWLDQREARLTGNYLLMQQWIPSCEFLQRHWDIRLLLQRDSRGKWQTTAAISRVARRHCFISNFIYQIRDSKELLKELDLVHLGPLLSRIGLRVCEMICKKLGAYAELSVDFLIDWDHKPWIIEINGKPRKDLFAGVVSPDTLENVYFNPLDYGAYLLNSM